MATAARKRKREASLPRAMHNYVNSAGSIALAEFDIVFTEEGSLGLQIENTQQIDPANPIPFDRGLRVLFCGKGSQAERCGAINAGDLVVRLDARSLTDNTRNFEQLVSLFSTSPRPVTLTIRRWYDCAAKGPPISKAEVEAFHNTRLSTRETTLRGIQPASGTTQDASSHLNLADGVAGQRGLPVPVAPRWTHGPPLHNYDGDRLAAAAAAAPAAAPAPAGQQQPQLSEPNHLEPLPLDAPPPLATNLNHDANDGRKRRRRESEEESAGPPQSGSPLLAPNTSGSKLPNERELAKRRRLKQIQNRWKQTKRRSTIVDIGGGKAAAAAAQEQQELKCLAAWQATNPQEN